MYIGTTHKMGWMGGTTQQQIIDDCVEKMVLAEHLGFYAAWMTEHHFASDQTYDPLGIPGSNFQAYDLGSDALTFLTYVAAKTSRIRLGTGVVVLHYDNPLRVAERAAMLDVLSNGRLDLGVGRGSGRREPNAFHVPTEGNRERFKEALDILLQAWTGETFSYDGQFYQVPELAVVPRPRQRPHPPVYIAASGQESFAWAGNYGLPYCYVGGAWAPIAREMYPRQHNEYLAAARQAGHDTSGFNFPKVLLGYCTDTDAEAYEVARHYIPLMLAATEAHYERQRYPADPLPVQIWRKPTNQSIDEIAEQIIELNIIGSPETCIRKLGEYQKVLDIDYLLLYVDFGGIPKALSMPSMERLAKYVLPKFSDAGRPAAGALT